jgi:hypothetical protein
MIFLLKADSLPRNTSAMAAKIQPAEAIQTTAAPIHQSMLCHSYPFSITSRSSGRTRLPCPDRQTR